MDFEKMLPWIIVIAFLLWGHSVTGLCMESGCDDPRWGESSYCRNHSGNNSYSSSYSSGKSTSSKSTTATSTTKNTTSNSYTSSNSYKSSASKKTSMPDCDDYDSYDDFMDDWDGRMPDGSDAEDYWENW